jgi:GTPase SAR1 family protein
MEKTIDIFKEKQDKTLAILDRLSVFLEHGKEAGVDIDDQMQEKLRAIIKNASGKLKIALIGGFSEGKTTIAAAWMEKLDKSSMKISHQESSDEVTAYDVDDTIRLIDTPGLFGAKEKLNQDTLKVEKYKAITQKYVSEANLVLYVMNSANPIKDSHTEELQWLFRTLNLLPRTVFVLSLFDEVADVADEHDYQVNLKIKRENVQTRLKELLSLTEQEQQNLSIVGVSANPFDMDIEHWLGNPEEFRRLSHIGTLQDATAKKIETSGGYEGLMEETRRSVIGDVLNNGLPLAIKNDEKISVEIEKLSDVVHSLEKNLGATEKLIHESRNGLRNAVVNYFTDLILQARNSSLETFNEFYEREIGSEGIVMENRLQSIFSKHLSSARLSIEKMETSFNLEVSHFQETVSTLGKQGINMLSKSGWINNTSVLAVRDGISTAGKWVGLDLGKFMKFKPYGATKLANGLGAALAVAGIALEAWDSWREHQRQEAFQKAQQKVIADFEQQRKDILQLINGDEFTQSFFGDYLALQDRIHQVENSLESGQRQKEKLNAWRKEAEALDVEFRRI